MPNRVDIARSLVPRRASLGTLGILFDPPTVRVAFQVLALAGTNDRQRLLHVLRQWIPRRLVDRLFEMGPTQRTLVLREMLYQGADGEPLPDAVETAKRVEKETATDGPSPLTLDDVWFEYCAFWGMDPFTSMDMPFPFFLQSVGRTFRLRARQMLRDIECATAPHLTRESHDELKRTLRRQAGITAVRLDEGTEDDWERERAALRAKIQGMA